ncbi:MAG TPA: LuxR C-terminal-related transcriptional regulator [Streptosporangiaceae bacterium]|nr:LuxR C-terminal-related transcriptional regulator [Streptosporangiaceae bacterium]
MAMIDRGRVSTLDEPDSFVGRERELDEVRRLARNWRAVTLCGAGGIGKTRLLLRLVALMAGDYPDGTWFIELGDLRQPELVVSRVAAAIGVEEEPGVPLLDTLADALRTRRLLLALDNCEHLVDACASLCQRLLASSPGLQVLATSREALRVAAEAAWPVPPLALPPAGVDEGADELASADDLARYDAVRLFADRASAAAPGFALGAGNTAAVVAVCRALDGLPLAIELAAAWVRVLSVEQIAARLDDRFHLLTSRDRSVPPRQRTLRAAIDWSYDLLTRPEQVLLRRLSVFAGWSLEMAEQVCADAGLPASEVLDLLAALADKSLVEVEPDTLGQTRYRMLETIREYAAARLVTAGEDTAVRSRLRDYTLGVVEHSMGIGMALVAAPWSARADVFRRWDADAGNAREVLSWCLAQGDTEAGLRICTAVRPCWIVRGSFAEGAEWFDSFLAADLSAVPPSVHGPALVGRAQLSLASDPRRALAWAAAGLELCQTAGDGFWTATALNLLAEAALHTGHSGEAVERSQEALASARQAHDKWNEGYALGTRAAAAGQQGNLREAQELAEAALSVMREIDQRWGAARTLLGLGDLARLRRDDPQARQHYLAALITLREIRAGPETARCLAGLGRVAMEQGDLRQAREHLAESLQLSLTAGSRIGIARGLSAFAALAVREGRPGRAVQLTAAVTALREAASLPPLPGATTQRYLDAAADLGEHAVGRLWADGLQLTSSAAAKLALGDSGPQPDSGHAAARPAQFQSARAEPSEAEPSEAELPAGKLSAREREVVELIALGKSNKAIAEELFISPATAARHVANILAKLGFTSRSQVAAWAASADGGSAGRPGRAGPG